MLDTNRHRRRAACAGVLLAAVAVPGVCLAHGASPGLAGFAQGLIHPLVEPAQLIALLAFVALVGQRGLDPTGWSTGSVAAGACLGMAAAAVLAPWATTLPLLGFAAVCGVAVAAARTATPVLYPWIGAALGVCIGLDALPEGPLSWAWGTTLAGTAAGCWVWPVVGTGVAAAAHRPWQRVLLRVMGSWMAACALLILALSLATPRQAPSDAAAPGTLDVGR